MARRGYYTEPWEKKLEEYQNFSGGINTTAAQDLMGDHELTTAVNVSLDERGSVARRTGMKAHRTPTTVGGTGQGFFRFYKSVYDYEEIVAIDGKLEIDGVVKTIDGLPEGFQTERFIEAVQYYDKMYFATGSRLVEYDGTTLKVVEPHKPQPLEALYVGTNGLADNPNDYLENGTGSTLQITGVIFSERYGVMNEPFSLTAYYSKKAEDSVEYQFEYRYPFMEDGVWHLGQDWDASNVWTFIAEGEGDMQFRINARVTGGTVAEAQYLVPSYRIKPAPDPNDVKPEDGGIKTCNRILVHWDRLILYGDTTNFNVIYISHLKNPSYFPVPNSLIFETKKNEPLNAIVRFRDHLVAFTNTSIQALFGKSPTDYRRTVLNTSVGSIAPKSVAVMDNYIVFLSLEGVYYLKSIGYVDDKANVAPLDDNVKNLLHQDKNAVGIIYEDQYHLTYPTRSERFRYYKALGAWVKDESPHLNITSMSVDGVELYGQLTDGSLVQFDNMLYKDLNHIYTMKIETKYFAFGQPYHRKKLKELQLTLASTTKTNVADMNLFIDGMNNISDTINHKIKIIPTEPYDDYIAKLKIKGNCMRTKVQILHTADDSLQLMGLAFILKLKKP